MTKPILGGLFHLKQDIPSVIHTLTHYSEVFSAANIPYYFVVLISPSVQLNRERVLKVQSKNSRIHIESGPDKLTLELFNRYPKVTLWSYLPITGIIHTDLLKEYYNSIGYFDSIVSSPEKREDFWQKIGHFFSGQHTTREFDCIFLKRAIIEDYFTHHQNSSFSPYTRPKNGRVHKVTYKPILRNLSYYTVTV